MQRKVLDIDHPINKASYPGLTPLMRACYEYKENSKKIKILLDYGADPNVTSCFGSMSIPLHWASLRQSGVGVKLLLDAGADLLKVNHLRQNAAHLAAWHGNLSALQVLIEFADKQGKIKNLLLQPDSIGETPLHKAVWDRHPSCVKLILESISSEELILPYELLRIRKKQNQEFKISFVRDDLLNIEKYLTESKSLFVKNQQEVVRFGLFGACKSSLKLLSKNPIFEPKVMDRVFDFLKP